MIQTTGAVARSGELEEVGGAEYDDWAEQKGLMKMLDA